MAQSGDDSPKVTSDGRRGPEGVSGARREKGGWEQTSIHADWHRRRTQGSHSQALLRLQLAPRWAALEGGGVSHRVDFHTPLIQIMLPTPLKVS